MSVSRTAAAPAAAGAADASIPGLASTSATGALTIRRSVAVNVPHPANTPANHRMEDEENVPPAGVHRALKVGRSDDPLEIEADQVADRILRMPQPTGADAGAAPAPSPAISSASGGRPLDPATRTFFEPRFGVDLGGVRLHTGPQEATAAARLNARAFAYGSGIWLGAGEHEGDRRLMAHELTHVVQASHPHAAPGIIRRYTRTNTVYLWDVYEAQGRDPARVGDADLRTTIEYEDYRRADLDWRFSDTVALAALRRSMDLFVTGVRGRGPNYIRSGREARAAAHGLDHILVTELGFTGDHMMRRVATWGGAPGPNIDDPDGSAPVWSLAGPGFPVAYTKGAVPTMFARFAVSPAIAPAVSGVQVRAKAGGAIIGTASGLTMTGTAIEGAAGTGRVDGIGGGAAIPGSADAGQLTQTIEFEVSTDAGRIWFRAGDATVRLFFTDATPMPPGGALRQDAVDIATMAALAPPIPDRLAQYVQSLVFYDPSVSMPAAFENGDGVMRALIVPHQCDTQAYLMRYLLMSIGIPASVDYFWRGTASNVIVYHVPSHPTWYGPSYQYDRPAEQLASAQPHFYFHALTNVAGVRYDPTYGQSSVGAILESAPGATDQFHPRSSFLATTPLGSPFTCPH